MMTENDRAAIDGLFEKLDEVKACGAPREPEAEAYIRDRIARNPAHAYYLAQTVIVQEEALARAEERIAELEAECAERRARQGGLFGSLFGSPSRRMAHRPARGPAPMPGAGGGFLAGAAQTAIGVTGGVLLGNAIAGLLGDDGSAEAAEDDPFAEDSGDIDDAEF